MKKELLFEVLEKEMDISSMEFFNSHKFYSYLLYREGVDLRKAFNFGEGKKLTRSYKKRNKTIRKNVPRYSQCYNLFHTYYVDIPKIVSDICPAQQIKDINVKYIESVYSRITIGVYGYNKLLFVNKYVYLTIEKSLSNKKIIYLFYIMEKVARDFIQLIINMQPNLDDYWDAEKCETALNNLLIKYGKFIKRFVNEKRTAV